MLRLKLCLLRLCIRHLIAAAAPAAAVQPTVRCPEGCRLCCTLLQGCTAVEGVLMHMHWWVLLLLLQVLLLLLQVLLLLLQVLLLPRVAAERKVVAAAAGCSHQPHAAQAGDAIQRAAEQRCYKDV